MFRPRVIPVLLLKQNGLVKTRKFSNETYVGDPINAVRIFNELDADELVLLDIEASSKGSVISAELVKEIGEEANMPISVGGGITKISQIKDLIEAGAERIIINSYGLKNPHFISESVNKFGSSTITVSIDYKKTFFGKNKVYTNSGKQKTSYSPLDAALLAQKLGAGEVLLQSIDHEGEMKGYDFNMIKEVASSIKIPLVAIGGAKDKNDLEKVFKESFATGVAAGSYFVFQGKHRGVLIQYPPISEYDFKRDKK